MQARSAAEVLIAFARLGLTSFGGPVAHLGFFREEFVRRRAWLDDRAYTDLVALCQFLPGPASSQVGMAIGLSRAGYAGALAAWIGFTLPSAVALWLFASGVTQSIVPLDSSWLHGLKVAAVSVVAAALLGMARSLAPDPARATLAVAAAAMALADAGILGQLSAILLGAAVGLALPRPAVTVAFLPLPVPVSRRASAMALAIFVALLAGLPLLAAESRDHAVALIDAFYRSGALVFGGGHVVLPLLQAEVVTPGWVSRDTFLAGYGAAQAVPGPLFTFAAYLGAIEGPTPHGWRGAALCLVAVFLPSILLVIAAVPYWEMLRRAPLAQAAMRGVNASVVGLLLAAFYRPIWTSGIEDARDFALASAAFVLLLMWRMPSWLVVLLCAVASGFLPRV